MSSYTPGRRIVPNDFFLSELAKENSYPDFYQGSAGSNAVDPKQLDPSYGTNRNTETPNQSIPNMFWDEMKQGIIDPAQHFLTQGIGELVPPIQKGANAIADLINPPNADPGQRPFGFKGSGLLTTPEENASSRGFISEAIKQIPQKLDVGTVAGGVLGGLGSLAKDASLAEKVPGVISALESAGEGANVLGKTYAGLGALSEAPKVKEAIGERNPEKIASSVGNLAANLAFAGHGTKLGETEFKIPEAKDLPFQYDPTRIGSLGGAFSTKPKYKGQEVDIIGRRGNTVRIKLPDGTEEKVGFSELERGDVVPKQETPKTKYTDITKELSDLLGEDVGKGQELNQEETPFVEGTEVKEPTIDPKDVSIVVPDKNIIPDYGSFPKPGRPGIQGPKLPGGKGGQGKLPPNEPPGSSEPPPENPKEPSEYGPKDRIATNLANFITATKRTRMAMGIPGTGINPHGFSTLTRSVGSEAPLSPSQASALGKTVKYLVNPSAAEASLNLGKVDLERFNEAAKAQGLGSFAGSEGIEKGDVHGKLSDLFETPLFRKIIPALKMEKAQQLEAANLQSGMEPSKATALAVRQAAETYGGLNNWSKSNAMKILTFAPDWLETNQKLGAGMLRNATTPNSPEGKLYRNLLLNTVGVYALKEIMQRSLGQGSSLSNKPGHEADMKVGQDSEGRNISIKPEATGFDFARVPYEAAMIASKSGGDLRELGKPIYNRLSDPVKIVVDLLSNTDYNGNPILGKTKYGKKLPFLDAGYTKSGKPIRSGAQNLANEISQLLPSPLQAGFQMSQDQKGYSSPYEAGAELISRSIGLPISFTSNFEPKKLPDVNPLGTNLNPKKKRKY